MPLAETREGAETTGNASSAVERSSMDRTMLIRGSKRLRASSQAADAQDSTSPSINPVHAALATENPDMDESLWGGLPDELMQRVMAWLPAANLLRLRTVCREWSKIIGTKCFLEVCSQVTPCVPYFVKLSNRETNRSLVSFDPSINRWLTVPISYLPSEVGLPLSSSGGLICFMSKIHAYLSPGRMLFVSNPLTKTWKQLPWILCAQQPMLVTLIMWKRPAHYKVIVAEEENTMIFDSVEGEWRKAGCLPPFPLPARDVSLDVVICDGSLYCFSPRGFDYALLAFNIHNEVWSMVSTSRLPGYRQFRKLVTCKGHMVIVGKTARQDQVCVWLLEWTTMKWREAGRMPQHMLDHFFKGRRSESFHCCSHGDLIFLTSSKCDMGLLFDLAQNMWRWAGTSPIQDGMRCFSFEPRLESQA